MIRITLGRVHNNKASIVSKFSYHLYPDKLIDNNNANHG
jgi:hypothetical protein